LFEKRILRLAGPSRRKEDKCELDNLRIWTLEVK
jgi:hypothetical protein